MIPLSDFETRSTSWSRGVLGLFILVMSTIGWRLFAIVGAYLESDNIYR
jgi:hypothetical protein